MKTQELIGYIGAAAWLPQIITWIYRAYSRPHTKIIPGKSASVGFTTYGPILNLNLAFSSERKAIIIESLEAHITHEKGESHTFQMEGMSETVSEIADASGTKGIVSKEHVTLAFKIGTDLLLEKFVRFQEPVFHQARQPVFLKGAERVQFERKQGGEYFQRIASNKEYLDVFEFYKDFFWWKPGNYSISFTLKAQEKFRFDKVLYSFTLTSSEIDGLRQNLSLIPSDYENTVRQHDEAYSKREFSFNWVTVQLHRQ